ncbi:BQ5605_C001g00392 [Microbotryum silenes-dioicae]|uniref:BQ5605_C001g00392 protein n=1 Tax=Microbotryum silenes-dioicae TaxID=796604 RepID=A0A2X0MQL2_9BASI|nr:BQ5605_C001g00392 [Microbotryum silenes-dioicae]
MQSTLTKQNYSNRHRTLIVGIIPPSAFLPVVPSLSFHPLRLATHDLTISNNDDGDGDDDDIDDIDDDDENDVDDVDDDDDKDVVRSKKDQGLSCC